MPRYRFLCQKCKKINSFTVSISKFVEINTSELACDYCNSYELTQRILPFSSKIYRNTEETKQEIRREAKKIAKKVKEGNQRTIEDIYGDKLNKKKFKDG